MLRIDVYDPQGLDFKSVHKRVYSRLLRYVVVRAEIYIRDSRGLLTHAIFLATADEKGLHRLKTSLGRLGFKDVFIEKISSTHHGENHVRESSSENKGRALSPQ